MYCDDPTPGICGDVLTEMARIAVAMPRCVLGGVVSFVPPSEIARPDSTLERIRITRTHDSEGIIRDVWSAARQLLSCHRRLRLRFASSTTSAHDIPLTLP